MESNAELKQRFNEFVVKDAETTEKKKGGGVYVLEYSGTERE